MSSPVILARRALRQHVHTHTPHIYMHRLACTANQHSPCSMPNIRQRANRAAILPYILPWWASMCGEPVCACVSYWGKVACTSRDNRDTCTLAGITVIRAHMCDVGIQPPFHRSFPAWRACVSRQGEVAWKDATLCFQAIKTITIMLSCILWDLVPGFGACPTVGFTYIHRYILTMDMIMLKSRIMSSSAWKLRLSNEICTCIHEHVRSKHIHICISMHMN
jgi:hypothetical protein